jgi:hypothetical protein
MRGGSGRQHDKMRLLLRSPTTLLRRSVPERVAPAVFKFPQRGEFPKEKPVLFLPHRYSTGTQSTSQNYFFTPVVFYRHAELHMGVDQLLS